MSQRLILNNGPLRFTADVAGPASGDAPTVLCLHGFPDHRRSFRHQVPRLVRAGYRVIVPDMRGYEPSSQPSDGDYHIVRLVKDVMAWLDELHADPVHLIGHDWGAVVGYAAAAAAPQRFRTLTTLAVPPLIRMGRIVRWRPLAARRLWYMLFFQFRSVPEHTLLKNDGAFIRRLWRRWSPNWTPPESEMSWLLDTFRRPGVVRSALSYYRALPDVVSREGRASWRLVTAPIAVPTLAMTGTRDGCMDASLYDVAVDPADFPRGVHVERVSNAGHFLHQERPDEVNRVLVDWLGAND